MPLQQLALQIVRINDRGIFTPVLVTPSYLSLRTPFFVALAAQIALNHRVPIRFEWYRGMPGPFSLIGDTLAQREAAQINRAFADQLQEFGVDASIRITVAISRPLISDEMVIGMSADRHELPAWTVPVRLTTSPLETEGASPVQSFHLQSPQTAGAA